MLAKRRRLNVSKSFRFVSSGKKVATDNLTVFYRTVDGDTLIGVAIKGKEFKGSVERNKAKRLVLEVIEDLYDDLRTGLNLIIMPRSGVLNSSQKSLEEEILNVKDLFNTD